MKQLIAVLLSLIAHVSQFYCLQVFIGTRLCFSGQLILAMISLQDEIIPLKVIGLIIFFWGLAFVILTRKIMISPKTANTGLLVKNGTFSVVRHPMYSGWNAMSVGLAVISGTGTAIILAAMQVVIFYAIICDEDINNILFWGAEYTEYAKRVPKTCILWGIICLCINRGRMFLTHINIYEEMEKDA